MGLCDDGTFFLGSHLLIVLFLTMGLWDDAVNNKYRVADTLLFRFHFSVFSLYRVADTLLFSFHFSVFSLYRVADTLLFSFHLSLFSSKIASLQSYPYRSELRQIAVLSVLTHHLLDIAQRLTATGKLTTLHYIEFVVCGVGLLDEVVAHHIP